MASAGTDRAVTCCVKARVYAIVGVMCALFALACLYAFPPLPASPDDSALCKDNPGCATLDGYCCPHEDGMMLACCTQLTSPATATPASGALETQSVARTESTMTA
uniref:Uncharacterized protein n=1 Tax=Noctiluca scintillans TaxID=2966 RepID=A0A7S1FC93_NOCSC